MNNTHIHLHTHAHTLTHTHNGRYDVSEIRPAKVLEYVEEQDAWRIQNARNYINTPVVVNETARDLGLQVCVCACVCVCVCVCVLVGLCGHIIPQICLSFACTHTRLPVLYKHTHTHMHTHMHTRMHTRLRAHNNIVCARMHTHNVNAYTLQCVFITLTLACTHACAHTTLRAYVYTKGECIHTI